jgi:hypothetical protein
MQTIDLASYPGGGSKLGSGSSDRLRNATRAREHQVSLDRNRGGVGGKTFAKPSSVVTVVSGNSQGDPGRDQALPENKWLWPLHVPMPDSMRERFCSFGGTQRGFSWIYAYPNDP